LVGGALRIGGALRLSIPFAARFFATGSGSYAFASGATVDARWFDASLGVGWFAPELFSNVDARVRLEALLENIAVTGQRAGVSDRQAAWVPGGLLGADVLWHVDESWLLTAHADVFALDGATPVNEAGRRIGTLAGAGLLLGLGAGHRF
jgi:hypothetical protein